MSAVEHQVAPDVICTCIGGPAHGQKVTRRINQHNWPTEDGAYFRVAVRADVGTGFDYYLVWKGLERGESWPLIEKARLHPPATVPVSRPTDPEPAAGAAG